VPQESPDEARARRAYRHQLRIVARLLRWTGATLVLLGAAGIAFQHDGAWYVVPSWFSFVLGWVLVISGIVRRQERTADLGPQD
jgi:hypothetical protein